jgi:MraZ protein
LTTFRGQFEHALDDKHRLTIPAKFRSALAGGVVLAAMQETTPGTPRSIAIWPPDAYESYTEAALEGTNPLSPQARDMERFFFNYSHDAELDSAHRVMIPPKLLEYAGLGKEVIVTGSGKRLELFDRTAYTAYSDDVLARVPDIAASLGNTN